MSLETQEDFRAGSGGELRTGEGKLPKMHALHSSSILVCNVFDYWRLRGVDVVGRAFGSRRVFENLRFEAKFPTGLPGEPPNLDVAFRCESGNIWAIESKFTEPFEARKSGLAFKTSYFPGGRPVWIDRGLPKCAVLALALQTGRVTFRHLDAAQLLKHALGLQTNHAGSFSLVYLYADEDAPDARQHRQEVAEFAEAVDEDFPFVSLSYHLFLSRLRTSAATGHHAYFEYLTERYRFATDSSPEGL